LIPYKSPGTRYGTLPHRCGYLGYKKESQSPLPIRTPPLLSKQPILLPILTGQDLSKELNRQSQWHQLLLNPPLIHRQFTSACGLFYPTASLLFYQVTVQGYSDGML
jgi:hypothetical protein